MGPSWLAGILAAVMILTAIYCVARIVISRTQDRQAENDVDGVHAAMGVAMAGMLVARLQLLPNVVWAVVFSLAAAWFAWRIGRAYLPTATSAATGIEDPLPTGRNHLVPHLVMCGAMVYMLLAASALGPGSGGGAMNMGGSASGGHLPVLALILSVYLFGYAVWETDRIHGLPRVSAQLITGGVASAVPAVALPGGGTVAEAVGSAEVATTGTTSTAQAAMTAPSGDLAEAAAARKPVSPRLEGCCQVVMAVTMAYMLVLML
ncbi:MAG TPA: DUF5134 domain-containing protein [Streptosporangiaceae bacterium]|nr:DUF5134 domain-containing protein [Streptosporangiaceae bacterium]